MPSFNIVKKNEVEDTFRVQKIKADFDIKSEHSNEHFVGELNMPDEWNIGLICGASGTGKTTIAKELFPDIIITEYEYKSKSVIDDMPKDKSIDEIEKAFYAVGFGSVPCWLKPYKVLSNGEKMRVDLARSILSKDKFAFDEFTSVVDRNVAKTCCIAINKIMKKTNKQFIAISCHKDIINDLQPDWIFDTDKMEMVFTIAHDNKGNLLSKNVGVNNGENLGVIII